MEDSAFIQKETYFIQIRQASERIQLALNPVIPPKGNALTPLENALHMHDVHVYCIDYIPKLGKGGLGIHAKGEVFHTYTTCIWKDATGIEPCYTSKGNAMIQLENALHTQDIHVAMQ